MRCTVAGLLLVEHDAGVSGAPESYRLGPVASAERESELLQQGLDRRGVLGADLHEIEPGRGLGLGQAQQVGPVLEPERGGVLQPDQRAQGVRGGAGDVGLPEDVVEDFQGQGPVVAGAQHVGHEGGEVERAFAREEPVVA